MDIFKKTFGHDNADNADNSEAEGFVSDQEFEEWAKVVHEAERAAKDALIAVAEKAYPNREQSALKQAAMAISSLGVGTASVVATLEGVKRNGDNPLASLALAHIQDDLMPYILKLTKAVLKDQERNSKKRS